LLLEKSGKALFYAAAEEAVVEDNFEDPSLLQTKILKNDLLICAFMQN